MIDMIPTIHKNLNLNIFLLLLVPFCGCAPGEGGNASTRPARGRMWTARPGGVTRLACGAAGCGVHGRVTRQSQPGDASNSLFFPKKVCILHFIIAKSLYHTFGTQLIFHHNICQNWRNFGLNCNTSHPRICAQCNNIARGFLSKNKCSSKKN